MGLFKKHAADRGLTWPDAVPVALCWGWIDSVMHRVDDDTVRQRWTPRKPGSNWSKINIAMVQRLTTEGRMQPSGLAAFERRHPDKVEYSYERDGELALPDSYEAMLRANAPATEFFYGRATPSYRKVCINWVMQAKTEATRDRRMADLITDSAAGQLIKPQRYGELPKWARPDGPTP